MAALPRILTVDPTGRLSRIARAAIDMSDLAVVQVDLPGGAEALDELRYVPCTLVLTALSIDGVNPDMDGLTLAQTIKREYPLTGVVVVADGDEGPDEVASDVPFLYLKRPLDAAQVMRILIAALNFRDIFSAAQQPSRRVEGDSSLGALPPIDPNFALKILNTIASDLTPMAVALISRVGEVIAERGVLGYIDREALGQALVPNARATASMSGVVGERPAALNFFDGDRFDIFTLSVGFHYMLVIIFEGELGQRQFGAVNRFGRRAVEDLLVMMGSSAFALDLPPARNPEEEPARRRPTVKAVTQETAPVSEIILEKAQAWDDQPVQVPVAPPPPPEPARMEPIANFDAAVLDGGLSDLDALLAAADDFFDMDRLAEIADDASGDRAALSYEEARQLGILK